ncbi:TraR/DksA family transcriptional regulator [Porticoccus sp.]|uniref:TraR/DksA family transcriptional regulator n=1 Tax=Porticoccus sp. TaxID=2024853 RepID=UPI003F69A8C7
MQNLPDKQLNHFRDILESLRVELSELLDISTGASQTVTLDQTTVGKLSRMDALQQQQMCHASRSAYRKRLVAVERALQSLDQGEYGWCEQCGELIDSRRLEIKPESARCIGCQQLSETEGA